MRGFEPHSWHFFNKTTFSLFFSFFLLVLTIIYSNPIQCMSFFLCTHDNSPRTSHDHRHHKLKHTPAISNIFLDAIDDGLVFHFFKKRINTYHDTYQTNKQPFWFPIEWSFLHNYYKETMRHKSISLSINYTICILYSSLPNQNSNSILRSFQRDKHTIG